MDKNCFKLCENASVSEKSHQVDEFPNRFKSTNQSTDTFHRNMATSTDPTLKDKIADFTQETTFHGIKYVFNATTKKTRRLVFQIKNVRIFLNMNFFVEFKIEK